MQENKKQIKRAGQNIGGVMHNVITERQVSESVHSTKSCLQRIRMDLEGAYAQEDNPVKNIFSIFKYLHDVLDLILQGKNDYIEKVCSALEGVVKKTAETVLAMKEELEGSYAVAEELAQLKSTQIDQVLIPFRTKTQAQLDDAERHEERLREKEIGIDERIEALQEALEDAERNVLEKQGEIESLPDAPPEEMDIEALAKQVRKEHQGVTAIEHLRIMQELLNAHSAQTQKAQTLEAALSDFVEKKDEIERQIDAAKKELDGVHRERIAFERSTVFPLRDRLSHITALIEPPRSIPYSDTSDSEISPTADDGASAANTPAAPSAPAPQQKREPAHGEVPMFLNRLEKELICFLSLVTTAGRFSAAKRSFNTLYAVAMRLGVWANTGEKRLELIATARSLKDRGILNVTPHEKNPRIELVAESGVDIEQCRVDIEWSDKFVSSVISIMKEIEHAREQRNLIKEDPTNAPKDVMAGTLILSRLTFPNFPVKSRSIRIIYEVGTALGLITTQTVEEFKNALAKCPIIFITGATNAKLYDDKSVTGMLEVFQKELGVSDETLNNAVAIAKQRYQRYF